jgi:hypothetical protein
MYNNIRCKILDYVLNLKRKYFEGRSFINNARLTALRHGVKN